MFIKKSFVWKYLYIKNHFCSYYHWHLSDHWGTRYESKVFGRRILYTGNYATITFRQTLCVLIGRYVIYAIFVITTYAFITIKQYRNASEILRLCRNYNFIVEILKMQSVSIRSKFHETYTLQSTVWYLNWIFISIRTRFLHITHDEQCMNGVRSWLKRQIRRLFQTGKISELYSTVFILCAHIALVECSCVKGINTNFPECCVCT